MLEKDTITALKATPSAQLPDPLALAVAVEQTAEAIMITDPSGVIQFVNQAFTRLTGYTPTEVVGQNPRILKSDAQSPETYRDLWRTVSSGVTWHGHLVNRRKNGLPYCEQMSVIPVRSAAGAIVSYVAIKTDMAEARAGESAHQFLSSLIENTDDAVVSHSLDGTILTWNRAAEQVHGYRAEEVIGKPVEILIAPESLGLVRGMVGSLRGGETFRQVNTVARRKDGSRVNVQVSLSPIRSASGEITATSAIVRDVTQQIRAERAMRESEERFRAAFESAPVGICLSSPEKRIIRANSAFCRMLGCSEEELIAADWMDITYPEDRAASTLGIDRLLSGEVPWLDFEKRYLRKNGGVLWAHVRISLMNQTADEPWQFVTHIEDITAKKQADESLRHSEERYRRLVANLPDVTWTATSRGQVTYVSPNIDVVTGYTSEEICAENGYWISQIHPRDIDRVRTAFRELFSIRKPFDQEYRFRSSHGEWMWFHSRAMRTYEFEGVHFTDGIFTDITARRRAEEALAESEMRYRLLFERNLAGVFRALPDEKFVDCNDAFLRIMGCESRSEFLAIRTSEIFFDPVVQRSTFERLYRERILTNNDVRLKRMDGTPIWVIQNISLISDENGDPAFIEGTVFDISARKQAEHALRESELKYRTLVTNIPDVVWTADAVGRRIFVSPNCENIYGHPAQDVCRQDFWQEQIHPEDRERVNTAYARFLERGEPYDVQYRVRKNEGAIVWIHDRAFGSYEEAGFRYADGCSSDVTEQKNAALVIEQLQRRTELILNSAGEGIVGLDLEGKMTFVNPAAARMLGSSSDTLVGKKIQCAAGCAILQPPSDRVEHHGTGQMCKISGDACFPVKFTSTPKIEDGRIVGSVVVFRDVTEEKLVDEQIRASLREKEALLREIHHRVKNNLQIVCSLLKLNSRNLRNPEALHVFEDTRHRVKAMALVHETLYRSGNLAGIDFSGYVPLLVDHLLHAYGLSGKQVTVRLDVEASVLPIDTAIPCALMLTELVSNAAKHVFVVQPGGELRVMLRRLNQHSFVLQVEDSGIPGSPPSTEPAAGSSFGMELIRLLTEQLEGVIEIDRCPGLRVRMVFPLSSAGGNGHGIEKS